MTKSAEIREHIYRKMAEAKTRGEDFLILVSGDIHRELNLNNSMPSVCDAMYRLRGSLDEIIHTTPSGKSSTIKIKYFFGNQDNSSTANKKESLIRQLFSKLKSKEPHQS